MLRTNMQQILDVLHDKVLAGRSAAHAVWQCTENGRSSKCVEELFSIAEIKYNLMLQIGWIWILH